MFNSALLMNKPASGGGLPTISNDYEASSSQSLSMTDANFGAYDRAKFAVSMWVLRESTGSAMVMFAQATAGGQRAWRVGFDSSDHLDIITYEDGTNIAGRLVTTATYTSTAAWYHILFWYDSANATAGDRMRLWVNGSEVTSFGTDTNPTAAVFNSTNTVTIASLGAGSFFDGLEYQTCFFSGTLPDISTLYNAGSPLSVVGMTGLYSYLDGAGGSVVSDGVLAADWTNNNTVTASSTIPT